MSLSRQPVLSPRQSEPLQSAYQTALPIRPRSAPRPRRNLFLDLPIGWRLTIGFLIAALIAALASGIVGSQRAQSLSRQTDFYHNLLQLNTSLTSGRSFLELMNSKLHQTLDDATAAHPSQETLKADVSAIQNLTGLYAQTLKAYSQNDLLAQHPAQLSLLSEAGDDGLPAQQMSLTNSAGRTWNVYQTAQQQTLNLIAANNLVEAQLTLQQQDEPTSADALSALHSLIQLNDRLASDVDNATNIEIHNQLITTLLATLCAFLAIGLVGWFISDTLVRRLRDLHHVTRAVEDGRINERVSVAGRDEIAGVADAVNGMLDTITGLLEETRQQRDALAGAAEHLFTDMRIVNAGDLRVNATVSNDPIGMLANAFNFTVGRFRRFILRTQTTTEQLDVVSRQGLERSSSFIALVRMQLRDTSPVAHSPSQPLSFSAGPSAPLRAVPHKASETSLVAEMQQTRQGIVHTTRDELNTYLENTRGTIEKARISLRRLSELMTARTSAYSGNNVAAKMVEPPLQELLTLERLVTRVAWEAQQTQMTFASSFTRLDTALTHLTRLAGEQGGAVAPEFAENMSMQQSEQFQEFARQAGNFGVEVNTLSKRLVAIVQEMRTSVTPFHLDTGTAMSDLPKSFNAHASIPQ